jgi:hypothetical protein
VVTGVLGRRDGGVRFGATTSMPGSASAPLEAGVAACDTAVLPSPSSSDAEQERRSVLLAESVIVQSPDLMSKGRTRGYQRTRKCLPPMGDGLIFVCPGGSAR